MSLTTNVNYLTPSNFKITIDLKKYKNLVFFAQGYNHPSVSVEASTNYSSPRRNIPMAGDTIEYGDLTMNVILDENMEVYLELYDWLNRHVNEVQKNPIVDENEYSTQNDITVMILSSKNNSVKKIKYKDCVLTSIGDINFESMSQDGQIIFPVTFKITTFEIE